VINSIQDIGLSNPIISDETIETGSKSQGRLCDIFKVDEPFFVVQGKYERGGEELTVYCGVKRGQKKVFKKNQKAYDKLSER